ncbi:hypothetical protein [Methylocystis sp. Sn-Cys]|uniref:hypothetical protein n=1 Tax=Methylocystis sp. Sn-Cys TaxID=1701263 RepID=UPI001921B774|nr:hypothetical protein [Methylocystis sp. Sn-Cys]MBL1258106.1 hypothetical protein [Methylocystis sp. Sn-Cys]
MATKTDIAELKHGTELLHRDFAEAEARLRLEISQSKNDILRRVFGFNLALIGAVFAIIKFAH